MKKNILTIDPSENGKTGIATFIDENYNSFTIEKNSFKDDNKYANFIIENIEKLEIDIVVIETFINYAKSQSAFTYKENLLNEFIGRIIQEIENKLPHIEIHKIKAVQYQGLVDNDFLKSHNFLDLIKSGANEHEKDALKLLLFFQFKDKNDEYKDNKEESTDCDKLFDDALDSIFEKHQLIFDEKKHQYTFNNIVLPSATTIMNRLFPFPIDNIPKKVLERASYRGSWVHKILETHINNYQNGGYDLSELEYTTETPIEVAMARALAKKTLNYLNTLKIDASTNLTEQKYCLNPNFHKYPFAGTIDWIRIFKKGNYIQLIDFKTTSGKNLDKCAFQLSMYAYLLKNQPEYQQEEIRIAALISNKTICQLYQLKLIDDSLIEKEVKMYYDMKAQDIHQWNNTYNLGRKDEQIN